MFIVVETSFAVPCSNPPSNLIDLNSIFVVFDAPPLVPPKDNDCWFPPDKLIPEFPLFVVPDCPVCEGCAISDLTLNDIWNTGPFSFTGVVYDAVILFEKL